MVEARLEVWRAVRSALADIPRDTMVMVACSGGADSLSLAAALAHTGPRDGRRVGGLTVDHGLQPGSAERARSVAAQLAAVGLDPVEVIHVDASRGPDGPEGNARRVRFAALAAAAARHRAAAVLLGHTLDDQAETVLLGLARGSGARSLAGMAERSGVYRRPFLRLDRDLVRDALPAELRPWEDPHNTDPAYARVRVRRRVLPVLEAEIGPGVAAALARSARLLRADADTLDELADSAYGRVVTPVDGSGDESGVPGCDVDALADLPASLRWRVIRRAAIDAGSPATALTAAHVEAVDRLLTDWRGQRGIDLPGGVVAIRRHGRLSFMPTSPGA